MRYSERIPRIARARHDRRAGRKQAQYVAMADSLSSPDARALLLEIIAKEIEVRVAVVTRLARNGSAHAPEG